MGISHVRPDARPFLQALLAVIALIGLVPTPVHAADILLVSDSGQDLGIATALMADGHAVTISPIRFSGGSNAALLADLSAYDVVYWSQDGGGSGDAVTDAALFTNLNNYVNAGGRVLVTGYDSIASPGDPFLVSFLGGAGSGDVVGPPGVVLPIANSLTTGLIDIRGVTPTGGVGDTDHMTDLSPDTVAVCNSMMGGGAQWTLRTRGMGEIAYISNGMSSPSWTTTTPGGAGAFNAAIRNFAFATSPPCAPEGSACAGPGGSGVCRSGRCCTGCFDGICHPRGTTTACGAGGGACTNCEDGNVCTLDSCLPTSGTCFRVNAGTSTTCNDGLYCTATDTCNGAGSCAGAGTPCDDSNACTSDICAEATDSCSTSPLAEGAVCMGATPGVCHAAVCCRGCWTGTACLPGTAANACGTAGAACLNCADGDACTTDTCSAGACANPVAPVGTACDDGLYCSQGDSCSASGLCVAGTASPCDDGSSCTIDTCNDITRMCTHTAVARGCIIGGICHGEGAVNPGNPCEICDPDLSGTAWSANVGAVCGTASCVDGVLTASSCDATAACVSGTPMTCPSGACADATSCGAFCTGDGDCSATTFCELATGLCVPRLPPGTACDRTTQCVEGVCSSDGHCCNSACSSRCLSCAVPGTEGTCSPVPAGTDPDDDCPGSSCTADGLCESTPDTSVAPDGGTPDDGGATDAPSIDVGEVPDGGVPPGIAGGCCAVAGARPGEPIGASLTLLIVALLAARRRRR